MGASAGYIDWSMSRRAAVAYWSGERPLSKWTKAAIIEGVLTIEREQDGDSFWSQIDFNRYLTETLRRYFLYQSSWHHTSKHFNKTDFYAIDKDAVERNDLDQLAALDAQVRAEKKDKPQEQRAVKGTIAYEEWEGSRRHGRFVKHEKPCLVLGGWAYTSCGKKKLDGAHVLSLKTYDRAPKGTAQIYKELAKRLPASQR